MELIDDQQKRLSFQFRMEEERRQHRRIAGQRFVQSPETLYCSFCGKSQFEVEKLVAGPTVFICNECVDLCHSICHGTN